MTRAERLAALALSAAAFLWSGNFVAGRALRGVIDPAPLALLRWGLALLIFLPWAGPRMWAARSAVQREWKLLAALGLVGIAAFQTTIYLALTAITATSAMLMLSLAPVAILLGSLVVDGMRPRALQWGGSAVSLAGVALLLRQPADSGSGAAGLAWMALAVLLWAAYSLLLRRRPADLPHDVTLAASMAVAVLALLPLALIGGVGAPPSLSTRQFVLLAYVVVFTTLAPFLLWSWGVKVMGPERAGAYVHLLPVFGSGVAALTLGESLGALQLLGALTVLSGVLLVQRTPAARRSG